MGIVIIVSVLDEETGAQRSYDLFKVKRLQMIELAGAARAALVEDVFLSTHSIAFELW